MRKYALRIGVVAAAAPVRPYLASLSIPGKKKTDDKPRISSIRSQVLSINQDLGLPAQRDCEKACAQRLTGFGGYAKTAREWKSFPSASSSSTASWSIEGSLQPSSFATWSFNSAAPRAVIAAASSRLPRSPALSPMTESCNISRSKNGIFSSRRPEGLLATRSDSRRTSVWKKNGR